MKGMILAILEEGLVFPQRGNSYRILAHLTELLEDDGPKLSPYAFVWKDNPDNMVQDIFPVVFKEIVKVAIHDEDPRVHEIAQTLLRSLTKNSKSRV